MEVEPGKVVEVVIARKADPQRPELILPAGIAADSHVAAIADVRLLAAHDDERMVELTVTAGVHCGKGRILRGCQGEAHGFGGGGDALRC